MANVTIDLELLTKQFEASVKKATQEADKLGKTIQSNTNKGADGVKKLNTESSKELKQFSSNVSTAQIAMGAFVANIASNVVIGAIRGLGNQISDTASKFVELEIAQIGLAKTTNLTEKEITQLTNEFKELSGRIPASTKELLDLGQVAGQLGVKGTDNIALFSETVSKLAVASDLAGEEGAKSLIRILNVTGEGAGKISNFASSIVELGNNFAASESEIARVATEVARSTAQFDIGSANVAGIATALKSLGVQAQLGGSVVGKAFRTINDATLRGGKNLENLSKIVGISGESFKEAFAADKTKGFQLFIEGLGRIPAEELSIALESIGLKGDEVNKVLPVLAKRAELVGDAIEKSSRAFRENTALNDEAERAFQSLGSRLTILGNTIDNALVGAFSDLGKNISTTVGIVNNFFQSLNDTNKLDETRTQIDLLKLRLESLKDVDATGKLVKDNRELKESIRLNIEELEKYVAEQNKASNASTNIISSTGALQTKLESLENELKLVQDGFGGIFGTGSGSQAVDESKIIEKIQKVKAEIASLADASEDSSVSISGPAPSARTDEALEKERQLNNDLAVIRAEGEIQKREAELQSKALDTELNEVELEELRALEQQKVGLRLSSEFEKAQLIEDSANRQLTLQKLQAQQELDIEKIKAKQKQDLRRTELKQEQQFWNLAAGLASSGNNTLASIGKAAALTQLAIKTPEAVASSYAFGTRTGGPVLGAVLGTIAGAAMAAQAAKIAGVGGFEQGGVIPGNSFSGDNLTANVNSGEMVLNRAQQSQLFNQANGGGSSSNQDLTQIVEAIRNINITLMTDDNTIATSASRGVANGVVIGQSE